MNTETINTNQQSINVQGVFEFTHMNSNREILGEWKHQHNRVVGQGLTYLAKLLARQAGQMLYIGLYTGAYTPQATDTAATFPTSATEFTGYVEANRILWNTAVPSTPTVTNDASKAEFNINASAILTGAFCSTSPAKLSTTGDLYCAKSLTQPKSVSAGDILLVKYTSTFTNV